MSLQPLTIRKLADTSTGRRVVRYDPETGAKKLVNPDTPGDEHEPWPLLGLRIEGDAPTRTRVSTRLVTRGIAESWLEGVNGQPVVRPAGPRQDVWNSTQTQTPHVFTHYDEIIFRTVDGDVRYRVTHQPDKYLADGADDDPVTPEDYAAGRTRVDWFYDLELVS